MCDTFSFFSKIESGRSIFAKNSDRDPGEPQIIEYIADVKRDFESDFLLEKLPKYSDKQLHHLRDVFYKFSHPFAAVISRPVWIWGAEMGLNEKGVAIGNEAVFSKEPLNKSGLLGMDILRLALHNASSADEAADFIVRLIETYGQGGNGSYSGSLKYHNSFLVKDKEKAIIIESSGKNWAKKENKSSVSISNAYSLRNDYDEASVKIQGKNLKRSIEKKFFTFFSKGNYRADYIGSEIQGQDKTLSQIFSLLRSHIHSGEKIKGGMKSICVHPGVIVKSETTSSMLIDYYKDKQIIWHSSSPNPCVSLFKPLIISDPFAFEMFAAKEKSLEYFLQNRKISEYNLKNHSFFTEHFLPLRDKLESEFVELIYTNIESKTTEDLVSDCLQCYAKEKEYLALLNDKWK